MTGIQEGELDILDASPPCPPFSMSGTKQKGWGKEKTAYGMKQKNIEDLTWEVIRITGEMKPKVVICENVKGLTMDYASEHLQRMVNDFESQGYTTVWKVLKGQEECSTEKTQECLLYRCVMMYGRYWYAIYVVCVCIPRTRERVCNNTRCNR